MIHPNKKYRAGHLEIACYGKGMIMVNHASLEAPIPIGPQDEDDFWSKEPEERLDTVLDYLVEWINWEESDPQSLVFIGDDIARAREDIQ